MSKTAKKNRQLTTKIRCFHKASNDIYGAPKMQRDLNDDGEHVRRQRVGRLMKLAGIRSKVVKKLVVTTNSKAPTKPAPDRLRRCFATPEPNEAWVTDTTFIRKRKGWLFLAIVLDLYSRKIVGWPMSDRNNTQLVSDALSMAFWRRKVSNKIVVHSDRGSTYASFIYRRLIVEKNGLCSMSRKGDC